MCLAMEVNNELKLKQGIIPVIAMAFVIPITIIVLDLPIHLALFFELTITIVMAFIWGYKYKDIEKMMFSSFKDIGNTVTVLIFIGIIIGIWIANGTVPSMIYFGLKIIKPRYFLVLSFVITSLVSMAIGTAFGTASTIGLALISMARGLGIPLPMAAGAIISGSYVGDRMSPVSSIAIITAHSAGTDINEMSKHMLYTLIPPYIITLFIFFYIGINGSFTISENINIEIIIQGLENNFIISGWLMILPLLIIILAILRVPTVLNLLLNIYISIFLGMLISNNSWAEILPAMYRGINSNTGIKILDTLLSRGGIINMMDIIILLIFAVLLGGLFEKLGILNSILKPLLKLIHNKGQLICISVIASIITAILSCNQMLAVFLPGKMLAQKYDQLKVPRKDLGRALGDGGIITSPLIPWNLNALLMTGVLGVSTFKYLPYTFLPILLPLSGIIMGFITGKREN